MDDADRAYKNRQYKSYINLNKSFKSIEIKKSELYWYRGGTKKSMELICEKIWKKSVQKIKTVEKNWKKFNNTWVGKK